MNAPITPLDIVDFDQSKIVDWSIKKLKTGNPFGRGNNVFTFPDLPRQKLTLDIEGSPILFNRNVKGSQIGFSSKDPMLLGLNHSNQMPIHIIFEDPVEAIGTHVSAAFGTIGELYHAELLVRLSNDPTKKWWPINSPFELSEKNGSAPFLGVKINPGEPKISEIYFDVMPDTNSQRVPFQVAINVLRFFA